MPKQSHIPSCTLHKASGHAVVRLSGRDHYLGRYGTPEAVAAYDRAIAEWLAGGRVAPPADNQALTVEDVLARFWVFAEGYYQKGGEPTRELDNFRYAFRPLRRLYGESPANDFGPLKLKALRGTLIEAGLARTVINQRIRRIKQAFRWATSEQLVMPSVYQALATVAGLKRGRSEARETEPIGPVPDAVVEATLAHLPTVVAAMVRFQRFTAARPGEVCDLRPQDIDRTVDPWLYRPQDHKLQYRGCERVIIIGRRAQAILLPFLDRPADQFCFSPAESIAMRNAERRAKRQSKVQPSQVDRRKPQPQRKPGDRFNRNSYLQAIRRACKRAGLPNWSPNQLRHAAATELRTRFGIESAQLILGHSKPDTTTIYAKRDLSRAMAFVREMDRSVLAIDSLKSDKGETCHENAVR
jgi:integrase